MALGQEPVTIPVVVEEPIIQIGELPIPWFDVPYIDAGPGEQTGPPANWALLALIAGLALLLMRGKK